MRIRHYLLGVAAALAALPLLAADIDGKWNATIEGGPGGPIELVFDLKADGEKLGGNMTLSMMPAPTAISDGTIKGDALSFKTAITVGDGAPALVVAYTGKLKGDEISFTSLADFGQGPMETPFLAKRAK
jgi:hypothetical protein